MATLVQPNPAPPSPAAIVDPAELLRLLREALASSLGHQVQVSLRGAFALCSACVDRQGLEDALFQLALNARDLMPRGGPLEVEIRQYRARDGDGDTTLTAGRYLAIGFSDAGLGMTPRMLTRVFDSSPEVEERLSSVVNRLRRVRRFAALAGGQLKVESRLGYGARVEVFLPAA